MNEILMQMPDMRQVGDTVTILSTTNDESYKKLGDLATQLVQSLTGTPAPTGGRTGGCHPMALQSMRLCV